MTIERFEAKPVDGWQDLAIPREHLHIAWRFFLILILASLYLAFTITLLSAAAFDSTTKFLTLPLFVAVIIAAISVWLILHAYRAAHRSLVQRAAQEKLNHEHLRYIALAATLPAPIASTPLLVNGQSIERYDEAFPTRADMDYVVDQCDFVNGHGFTLANWLGRDMPSRKHIAEIDDWHALLAPLVRINAITEPQEHRRTQVLIRDAARVRFLLDQAKAQAKA